MQRERAEAREKGKEKRDKQEAEKESAGGGRTKNKSATVETTANKEGDETMSKLGGVADTALDALASACEMTEQEKQVGSSSLCIQTGSLWTNSVTPLLFFSPLAAAFTSSSNPRTPHAQAS
jgi:hypothetical protein